MTEPVSTVVQQREHIVATEECATEEGEHHHGGRLQEAVRLRLLQPLLQQGKVVTVVVCLLPEQEVYCSKERSQGSESVS